MQIGPKAVAVGLVGVAALVAGAYALGSRGGADRTITVAQADPHKAMPGTAAGHPPMDQPREGKVQVDPNNKFTHFRVGNRNVKRIYAEGDVMWVGTSGGLIKYNRKTDEYKLYDAKNGLLSNGVFYVGKVGKRIAVGTYGGGFSLLDEAGDKWTNYNVPNGLGDAFVYDLLEAKNGDLWVATWSGANRIVGGALDDRSKWELYTVENTQGGVPNDWVYGLAEGRNGDIWLATEGGVALYRGGQWTNWNHAKGVGAPYDKVKDAIAFKNDPSTQSTHHAKQKEEMGLQDVNVAYNPNYIVSLVVDKDGTVWAGTWGGGLSRWDGTQWKHFTTHEGLPGNHVFMLHIDPKQQLWVGTNNGLARMKGGKFDILRVADGLFADNVFAMTTAADGSLWVGSYGGVAHLRNPALK
jgi:ligand-binding sensor domain-containing protein